MPTVDSEAVAPRKTGRRSLSKAELQNTARLTGILEELDRGRVLDAFKTAVAPLGFPNWTSRTVDALFRYTRKADWQTGWARVVWPSNGQLCRQLGITLSGVHKQIRKLIDFGLIRALDSGTGKRWGKRCPLTQQILESCGLDLSPIGERMSEFQAASAEFDARLQEAKALRAQCSAWSRRVLSMTDYGIEHGLDQLDYIRPRRDRSRHRPQHAAMLMLPTPYTPPQFMTQ